MASTPRPHRHHASFSQLIIHGTPNLSTNMPKRTAQNVCASGMVTWPPSDSAAKTRSASLILSTDNDTEHPFTPS